MRCGRDATWSRQACLGSMIKTPPTLPAFAPGLNRKPISTAWARLPGDAAV